MFLESRAAPRILTETEDGPSKHNPPSLMASSSRWKLCHTHGAEIGMRRGIKTRSDEWILACPERETPDMGATASFDLIGQQVELHSKAMGSSRIVYLAFFYYKSLEF